MSCDRIRVLLGVRDELDVPTRRALDAHVQSCPGCAEALAAELEFSRLMSSRSVPAFSSQKRLALLTLPPPGLRGMEWRLLVSQLAPLVVAAVFLAVGATLIVRSETPRPPGVFPGESSFYAASDPVAATAVLRQSPVSPPPAVARDQTSVDDPVNVEPRPPQFSRLVAPGSTSGTRDSVNRRAAAPAAIAAVGARSAGASGQPATQPAVAPAASSGNSPAEPEPVPATPELRSDDGDQDNDGDHDDDGDQERGGGSATPAPTAATAALVDMRIVAVSDLAGGDSACPGCNGLEPEDHSAADLAPLGRVTVVMEALDAAGGVVESRTLTLATVDASSAALDVAVETGAVYRVSLGETSGFALCPTQSPVREIVASDVDGPAVVQFVLWQACPLP